MQEREGRETDSELRSFFFNPFHLPFGMTPAMVKQMRMVDLRILFTLMVLDIYTIYIYCIYYILY